MIGMILQIQKLRKNQTKSINKQRDDFLRRSASLALQICVLNGFALIICAFAAFFLTLKRIFQVINFWPGFLVTEKIFSEFLEIPQNFMIILSSNIGFFVHCYYSRLYRNAAKKTFEAAKTRFKKIFSFRFCCKIKIQKNRVQPT